MPWSAPDMKAKGARRPAVAAKVANAALAGGHSDASAIRIGLEASNNPKRIRRKLPNRKGDGR